MNGGWAKGEIIGIGHGLEGWDNMVDGWGPSIEVWGNMVEGWGPRMEL